MHIKNKAYIWKRGSRMKNMGISLAVLLLIIGSLMTSGCVAKTENGNAMANPKFVTAVVKTPEELYLMKDGTLGVYESQLNRIGQKYFVVCILKKQLPLVISSKEGNVYLEVSKAKGSINFRLGRFQKARDFQLDAVMTDKSGEGQLIELQAKGPGRYYELPDDAKSDRIKIFAIWRSDA
jgi:hypothetical protein